MSGALKLEILRAVTARSEERLAAHPETFKRVRKGPAIGRTPSREAKVQRWSLAIKCPTCGAEPGERCMQGMGVDFIDGTAVSRSFVPRETSHLDRLPPTLAKGAR